eukprot:s293_g5.t1
MRERSEIAGWGFPQIAIEYLHVQVVRLTTARVRTVKLAAPNSVVGAKCLPRSIGEWWWFMAPDSNVARKTREKHQVFCDLESSAKAVTRQACRNLPLSWTMMPPVVSG